MNLFDLMELAVSFCFVGVKPRATFHLITMESGGVVTSIEHVAKSGTRMNGGFMVLRQEIFSYMKDGEELVEEPFRRLIEKEQLFSYRHQGFWAAMDTLKDKITFDRMNGKGDRPWQLWDKARAGRVGK